MRDVMSALRTLPRDSAVARTELGDQHDWTHFAANVAELVDLLSWWINFEYARATADPDDPQTKRSARRKPPPIPLVPPVAHRPESVDERYKAAYQELVASFGSPGEEPPGGKRWVSSDDFDALLGL